MDRLIEAFKDVFTTATLSRGDLAETANFALGNVNWTGKLTQPEPVGHAMVSKYMEAACADSGPQGSSSSRLAEAVLLVADSLVWKIRTADPEKEPDLAVFSRNYTSTRIIGEGALLPCSKVTAGLTLQGRDTYYPPHAHHAEESYWIIGGNGDWKVDTKPWFAVEPGDSVYHKSGARHVMQTNEQPLLTVWLWTSHLDSEVIIVRG